MLSSGMLCLVALVGTYISEEHRFLQEPHGIISKKTVFFIVTAVKTSNFTCDILFSDQEVATNGSEALMCNACVYKI
jgi:hypothetical protein